MSCKISFWKKRKVFLLLDKNSDGHCLVRGKPLSACNPGLDGRYFLRVLQSLEKDELVEIVGNPEERFCVQMLVKSFTYVSGRRILWLNRIAAFAAGAVSGVLVSIAVWYILSLLTR